MSSLAVALRVQMRYVEAEQIQRESLELYEKSLGRAHPDTVEAMNNIAQTIHRQGKHEEAGELRTEIARIKELTVKQ